MDKAFEIAQQIVAQWENHDKFRITAEDEPFLVDGMPENVFLARRYISTYNDLQRFYYTEKQWERND